MSQVSDHCTYTEKKRSLKSLKCDLKWMMVEHRVYYYKQHATTMYHQRAPRLDVSLLTDIRNVHTDVILKLLNPSMGMEVTFLTFWSVIFSKLSALVPASSRLFASCCSGLSASVTSVWVSYRPPAAGRETSTRTLHTAHLQLLCPVIFRFTFFY